MQDGIESSESLKLAVIAVGVDAAIEKLKADKAQLDYKPLINELNCELSQCALSSKPRTEQTTATATVTTGVDQPGTVEEVILYQINGN